MRSHLRPLSLVGGNFRSPGSMVICLGLDTCPPLGPRSRYSPGDTGLFARLLQFAHLPHLRSRFSRSGTVPDRRVSYAVRGDRVTQERIANPSTSRVLKEVSVHLTSDSVVLALIQRIHLS